MFTLRDIENKTVFVVNCIDHDKNLRVSNGELLLEMHEEGKDKVLTKFPFQKILSLFIIGHITVTTPLIEKCKKFNVALVVMKPNLRPVFFWSDTAEANYLLRQRQHEYGKDDLTIASVLVRNKINNQMSALKKTRRKDCLTLSALQQCAAAADTLPDITDYTSLMGVEGTVSRMFFSAYFQDIGWKGRKPRVKSDVINVTLDIGYTILFNFIESFMRMFGFDIYIGVYHRLWFKRKSLICDIIEPFRCLVDHAVLLAFHRRQFCADDFKLIKSEYYLKHEKCAEYYRVFYDVLISKKMEIFKYVQSYYRCFMGRKSVTEYPEFIF